MLYAKINTDTGDVIEAPVFWNRTGPNDELPADYVKLDLTTNKPSFRWDQKAEITSTTRDGDSYLANYTVTDKVYADDAAKRDALERLHKGYAQDNTRRFDYKSKELVADYPDVEQATWYIQIDEATKYTADNTVSTPLLSELASARGITVADLAANVISKDSAYRIAIGQLMGKYQNNRQVLASVDFDDNTTWNNIDGYEVL